MVELVKMYILKKKFVVVHTLKKIGNINKWKHNFL